MVVLHILIAFAGLVALALLGTLVPRPRPIDKLAFATLLALCVITNPGKASHVEALRRTAIRHHDHLDAMVMHDDYFFASSTTTHRSLTFGLLGRVFVIDLRPGLPEEMRR